MNRVSRLLAVGSVAGLCALLAACGSKPTDPTPALAPAPIDVGGPLYETRPMPPLTRLPAGVEPVVIPQAVVQPDERVQIASQVDSTVLFYGVKLEQKPAVIDGNVIVQKYRNEKGEVIAEYYFRRLREGQAIDKDEVIVRLDEELLGIQLRSNRLSLEKTKEAVKASGKQVTVAEDYYQRMSQAGTEVEGLSALAQLARAQGESAQTIREQARLQGETEVTEFKFNQCFVRSPVDGRIVKFLKHPGEAVKPGEPLLEVQSSKRFRVEGKVDVQEANRIQLFAPAEVVPIRPVSPEPYSISHRREVSAVAVTAHADRPLVVSAGMDAQALVWEPLSSEKAVHVLPHPPGVGVKSVAVTGKDAGTHLAVTGGTDGKLRLWDLNDPNNLPKTPTAEFEEGLGGAVAALAFSPDGRYLAAAAGREVTVWSVADRKKKYALPADHRDDVTAVHFTPQATLVTVCRDKAVRVWTVGTAAAALAKLIDNRSGTVDVLGVSADGGKMLFDQDAGRLDVVSLDDGRSVGNLRNGGGTRFAGFAVFGPDDRFVLTAGGDSDSRGEMQLWEIGRADPTGASKGASPRAVERRRLVTPGRVAVTAAAFSPHPDKRFMVVGTAAGGVHYWVPPSAAEPYRTLRGKVTAILPTDARSATLRVEVDLPDASAAELLQDRGTAAILIDPTDPPEPPRLPAASPGALPKLPGTGAAFPPGVILPTGGFRPMPMK
jgi:WD40 repeat protein